MKKIITLSTIGLLLVAIACKQKTASSTSNDTIAVSSTAAATSEKKTPVASGPLIINEADWGDTDISTIDTNIPVVLKLPKDVAFEKYEGGVKDIINGNYVIKIQRAGASSGDLFEVEKRMVVDTQSYNNAKILKTNENGFVHIGTLT